MMKVAMQGAVQEFNLKMMNHVEALKIYIKREIADFVKREVVLNII
jgi:hypothetical protein